MEPQFLRSGKKYAPLTGRIKYWLTGGHSKERIGEHQIYRRVGLPESNCRNYLWGKK